MNGQYDAEGYLKPECVMVSGQLKKENPFQYPLLGKDGKWYFNDRDLSELLRQQSFSSRVSERLPEIERSAAADRWLCGELRRAYDRFGDSAEFNATAGRLRFIGAWASRLGREIPTSDHPREEYRRLADRVASADQHFPKPSIATSLPISFEEAQEDYRRRMMTKIHKN